MQGQVEARETLIYAPLENVFEATKPEFAKGEVAMMRLIKHLPQKMMEYYEYELSRPQGADDVDEN